MTILDTMVLIHLAKLSILQKKIEELKPIIIPHEVAKEATKNASRHPDAALIMKLIEKNEILVEEPEERITLSLEHLGIKNGELKAAALVLTKNENILFSNDPVFRTIGPLLNIRTIDTIALLVAQYKEKAIPKAQLLKHLEKMAEIAKYSQNYIEGVKKLLEENFFD